MLPGLVELHELMWEQDLTFKGLSRLTGLHPATLNQFANGKRVASDQSIEAIARGLDVEPGVFIEWRRRRVAESLDRSLVDELWARL